MADHRISQELAAAVAAAVLRHTGPSRNRLQASVRNFPPELRERGFLTLADNLEEAVAAVIGDGADRPGRLGLLEQEIAALLSGSTILQAPAPEPEPEPEPEPPASAWPWPAVPVPVMPTGLQVVTAGAYQERDGVEYRGGRMSPTVTRKRVVFRDVDFGGFWINGGAEDIWIIGGDVGPLSNGVHPHIAPTGTVAPKRVVIDGAHFHGMKQGPPPSDHTEGLQIGACDVLWVRNCRFDDNDVFHLLLRCWSSAPIRYVLIEDCSLGKVTLSQGEGPYHALRVAGDDDATKPTNVVIRRIRNASGLPFGIDRSAGVTVQGVGEV